MPKYFFLLILASHPGQISLLSLMLTDYFSSEAVLQLVCSAFLRTIFSHAATILSKTLARIKVGQYDSITSAGFPGFRIGMTTPVLESFWRFILHRLVNMHRLCIFCEIIHNISKPSREGFLQTLRIFCERSTAGCFFLLVFLIASISSSIEDYFKRSPRFPLLISVLCIFPCSL